MNIIAGNFFSMPDLIKEHDLIITIDYDKESPNPSRVFESMSNIIKSFEGIDKRLVKSIDSNIDTVLMLEDIEVGSLKSVLRNFIESIPDDSIANLEWKKAVGHYLVRAKYIMLNLLENKALITDGREIDIIEMELMEAAKEGGLDKMPYYVPVTKKSIITSIKEINNATKPLNDKDSATLETPLGDKATFNIRMKVDADKLEDYITNQTLVSESKMILKVKKADFLGESQWEFKHGESTIYAKILNREWLNKYQIHKTVKVEPQDALVCRVKTSVKYGEKP